ncbi:hypothetical protein, partial [Psychroserpens sp.]|uniref:hypothetical protein n=1 Tax=Psychroserpens sp. TaxID=2020870 RepID=UPI00385F4466
MKKLLLLVLLISTFTGYAQLGINQPSDYLICAQNDIADFDLDVKTPEILGSLNPAEYDVTYHLSEPDAFNQTNALFSPYTNTANPEVIYANVTELSTGNFEVTTFLLIVNYIQSYTWSFDLSVCDSGTQDGFAVFDLTQLEQEFMNGNQDIILSYHETFQDATDGTNAIFNPTSYTNIVPYNQDIYIRTEDPLTGCFFVNNVPALYLSVDSLNVANDPTPYDVCDDNDDGIVTFNLDNKTSEILGGNQNPTLTVTYHETLSDAEGFFNVLSPIYTNTIPFAQTVYARVSQNTGDCYDIITLDLVVNTDCVSASSVLVEFCAEANTPLEVDLTFEEPNIVNGQNTSDFIFTYYYSEADAQNENSPIANPEVFLTNDNTTIIYVRVEDAQSTNFTVIEYIIVLNFNPLIEFYGPFTICGGNDIVLYPFINNNNGAYEYLWSTGETNPEIIVNTGGVYTVTITDLISGCISTESVEVIEEDDAPVLADASDLTSCDSNTVFDLTLTLPEILNGQDPSSFIISFHNSFNDASSNDNPIIDVDNYIATNGVETIFVRVQNSVNACFSISDFTITTESLCVVDVDCAQPVTNTFCYTNGTVVMYQYTSVDGSPLQVFFTEGQVEVNYDELVVYDSDGFTNLNPTNIYGNNGDLAGLSFFSSGDSITVFVDSDGSVSCQDQGYTPISYEVSCADPNAVPDCNVILTQPLDGATDVDENTDLSWIAPSGVVTGYKISLGLTSGGTEVLDNEDVGNVLTYDMGILDFEVTYYVTITPYNTNGDADGCAETSFTTRTNPFQALVCEDGVVNTTYCYDNDDTSEFSFQSSDGLPLTIIFNAGITETNFDEVYIVDSDGTILNPDLVYGNFGDFAGLTYTSTGDSLTVRFDSDFTISCGQGSDCCTTEFDFDVFCASTVGFIQVNAFVDDNANSMYDANEFSFSNGYFTYEINGDGMINTVNSSTGHFQIISGNETDVYDITFNLYDESEACYDITTTSFDNISVATGSTVTIDFPVVEEQSCEDLGVYLINYWAPPRPGFTHYNFLVLENLGFTNISSGTVEFTHDPLLVYNAVTSVNPNYTITNTTTGFTVDFVNL